MEQKENYTDMYKQMDINPEKEDLMLVNVFLENFLRFHL